VSSNQRLPKGESVIVVANHVAWTDFYLIQEVAQRSGMLVRWFAKRSLKWVLVAGDGDASCEQEVDEG
jgi:1-acyl-sn-glycerol-3-phosphate acyltransferase